MGSQKSKIDISSVPIEEIKASSPVETSRFCPPFRKFKQQNRVFHGKQMEVTVEIEEPESETFTVIETVFDDLEQAFDSKTKDIELESVLFDEQYIDLKTYTGKDNGKETTLQLRSFTNFNTHAFNQILYEIHINEIVSKLNCPNLNTIIDKYVIQTGLELAGQQNPNTQVYVLSPIATNLSEIIKYRRQNKWGWTINQLNALATDLTNALVALHKTKISHNDIRPCNVFYSLEKNCYQLGCFGNSVVVSNKTSNQVRTSTFFGAPELNHSASANLQQADIYSLGMTLLCAFYLYEPIDRKAASPYNRKLEGKYEIMEAIREMIMPIEKRSDIQKIMARVPKGQNSPNMKSLIQSLKYKNSPKDRQLVATKKALSTGYKKLGLWNQWKDNMNEAYELEQQTLDDYKKANSLSQLARIESCRGLSDTAGEYSKSASKIYRNLGYAAYEQGNINESLNFFGRAINCSKYFEKQNDIDLAKNLQGLALAHAEKGEYQVSKPLVNEAGRIVVKNQGRDSLDYCKIRMSEAKIQSDFGQFDSADRILNQCLTNAEQKIKLNEELGLKLKAQVLHELGRNCMLQSSFSEDNQQALISKAERYIAESIEINEKFPDNHIALGANVETFGEIELRKHNYAGARTNFRKADLMRETYLKDQGLEGSMEKERADNLCNIAACDNGIGDSAQALKNYNEALGIYKKIYGSDHNKYSAITIGNMSKVYYKMNEKGKARECLKLSTQILEDLSGTDDPDYEYFKQLQSTL